LAGAAGGVVTLIALERDLAIAATAADDAYRHHHRLAVAGCATAKVFSETFRPR